MSTEPDDLKQKDPQPEQLGKPAAAPAENKPATPSGSPGTTPTEPAELITDPHAKPTA
jgi:hypothetical protein